MCIISPKPVMIPTLPKPGPNHNPSCRYIKAAFPPIQENLASIDFQFTNNAIYFVPTSAVFTKLSREMSLK